MSNGSFAMLLGAVILSPVVTATPLLSLRLRANETASAETWQANFKAIAEHPGCCDEIWFSTGCGVPDLDWHRANAAVLGEAVRDCRAKGIVPSLQFQATIGHGDAGMTADQFVRKTWTGWTGPAGIETKFCNCPRQPAFLDYLRDVSRIYAPLGFGALWIDDDLRIEYHEPSGSFGKHPGCWCSTCLAAFNDEKNSHWTRAELAKAVETNAVVSAAWRTFQADSVCRVAKTIAEVFRELSPETTMGLQHASYDGIVESVSAMLRTLHETSGRPVGSRPGGGSYYDDDPNEVVLKSIKSGWFRKRLGDPDYVRVWTPEIESWPRAYYSRSPQGVLVEGFTALMYGMNGVSFFISNSAMEEPALYGRTHWRALAAAEPVLRGYAQAIAGATSVGFTMPGKPQLGIRRAAIPVLAGVGRSLGELTPSECKLNVNLMTSAAVRKLRDDLDRRAGGLPAVVCSPFSGLMQVHVDAENRLAAVALANTRIASQGPVRVRLRGVPAAQRNAVWRTLGSTCMSLAVERTDEGMFVTIPEIGAWDAGYLDFTEISAMDRNSVPFCDEARFPSTELPECVHFAYDPTRRSYSLTTDEVEVSVDGQRREARAIRVSAHPFNRVWPGHQRPYDQSEPSAYVAFEKNGPAAFEVRPKGGCQTAVVRPLAANVKPTVKDGIVSFVLPTNGYYTVEFDDSHRTLHVFSEPPRDFAEYGRPTRVFGPGVHVAGVIKVQSGDRICIDRDAVVYGRLIGENVSDVKIFGGGVLDGSVCERVFDSGYTPLQPYGLGFFRSRDITVDGPVLVNCAYWCAAFFDCENVDVSHLKIVGQWRYNTDGIDICNSRHVRVHDCFVRSFDDTVCVKGVLPFADRPVEDIVVSRCVLWCGWGNTCEIGVETHAPHMKGIRFENCDLIHNAAMAMDVGCGGKTVLDDVTFRNIRVEYPHGVEPMVLQKTDGETWKGGGAGTPLLAVVRATPYGKNGGGGKVGKVVFEKLRVFADEGATRPIVRVAAGTEVCLPENLDVTLRLETTPGVLRRLPGSRP